MNPVMEQFFDSSSSDDDDLELVVAMLDETAKKNHCKRRGSVIGRDIDRRPWQAGDDKLWNDYFSENPVFGPVFFRRRFRMSKRLFLRIANAVEEHCPYFVQKREATGRLGHSCLKKVAAAIRMLGTGCAADFIDDWLYMAESIVLESLKMFVKSVVELFGERCLRSPNEEDTTRLLEMSESIGFRGMLGSIDCMHWRWLKCGQYTGHSHDPTVILEAVASNDLWIWHAYFGMPGSCNDISVLHRSSLFARLAGGEVPPVNFEVNGHQYNMGYYHADGIYPSWATFVKTISKPKGNKRVHFAKAQESARKDVERAFGVLQARWTIIQGPARLWDQTTLWYIVTACVILHNMILEDERGMNVYYVYDIERTRIPPVELERDKERLEEFLKIHKIYDREDHNQLHEDLVEHLWEFHGSQRVA